MSKSIGYPLATVAGALALAVLSGCGAFERAFSGSADAIDEISPQAAASIHLSPPQVFTREQLINDRMREDGFLVAQLANAASAPLGNSLSRDLQVITTLAAQLSVSVDPALKLNFQRANEQADLQQQINVTQLRAQLLTLQNQLAQLSLVSADPAASAAPTASPNAASAPTTVAFAGSTKDSDARIAALQARIDAVLGSLAEAVKTPRPNTVAGTLEDEFEDRLALRSRIREEINANLLDDSHDVDGNSLYHLQFMSTVMPGAKKAQYGVARLSITHRDGSEDYDLLYHTWLAAITNRMNQNLMRRGGDGKEPLNYKVLGPLTGLYDVARIPLTDRARDGLRDGPSRGGAKPDELMIAVHPGQRARFEGEKDQRESLRLFTQQLLADAWDNPGHGCVQELFRSMGMALAWAPPKGSVPVDTSVTCGKVLGGTREKFAALAAADRRLVMIEDTSAILPLARSVLEIVPSVEVAVHALGDRSLVSNSVKLRGDAELVKFRNAYEASRDLYYFLRLTCLRAQGKDRKAALALMARPRDPKVAEQPCDEFDSDAVVNAAKTAPARFKWALGAPVPEIDGVQAPAPDPERDVPKVVAFPYNTDPMMRVQRVSTVASAANAIELAAGLSAQMPGSGASVGGGVDFARRTSGRVDAMERVPEVIGFAGASPGSEGYEFGWVFGPRLSVDTDGSKLLLRQRARTVPVSADISVPGWWTRATLKVRVAWRGGFNDSGGMVGENAQAFTEYELPVKFRLNRASYDALTVTVMRRLTSQGYHQARIDNVRPEVLPICKDAASSKVTLLIYGVDLWRNPRVFLGGTAVPQDGISVLPDMTGLAATVDTATLSKQALRADGTVVVWTNHGVAEATIRTQVSANCEAAAGQAAAATETTLTTTIERVSPSQLSSCDDRATIALSGRNLPREKRFYRLGTVPALTAEPLAVSGADGDASGADGAEGPTRTVAVTFLRLTKANVGLGKAALSVVGADGLVSVPIEVVPGKCTPAPDPTYAFTAGVERLAVTADGTAALQLSLSLPAGKQPVVTVTAKGGEFDSAHFARGVKKPKGVQLHRDGSALKLVSSIDLKKGTEPLTLEVKLRNLVAGKALELQAEPPDGDTTGPLTLSIEVANPAPAQLAKAAP